MNPSIRRLRGITTVLVLMGSALAGCASNRTPGPSSEVVVDYQLSCEVALLQLERLIQQRSRRGGFSEVRLLEATELQALGRELYLEREYELALEMIEEGIRLLEETRD